MQAQCLGMMELTELPSAPPNHLVPFTDQLRLAVAAYLARFKGSTRSHTDSDLRCYLAWCAERSLDPLVARRPYLELYIRWMQEIRRVTFAVRWRGIFDVIWQVAWRRPCRPSRRCCGGGGVISMIIWSWIEDQRRR